VESKSKMWHLENIPKVVHLYWGNSTMSFMRYLTVYSFRKFNPDWEIKIYVPVLISHKGGDKTWKTREHSLKYNNTNYIKLLQDIDCKIISIDVTKYGILHTIPEVYKSDLMRWIILSNEGGLWSDFDILYYRPMNDLFFNTPQHKNLTTTICTYKKCNLIGFFLCSANNTVYKHCIELSRQNFNTIDYQAAGASCLNKKYQSLKDYQKQFPDETIINLPMDVVYPTPWDKTYNLFYTNDKVGYTDYTIGVHWFGGTNATLEYENTFTMECYNKAFASTFTRLVNYVLDYKREDL
jgi:hypothetical protein